MTEFSADYESFRSADDLKIFYRRYLADSEKARIVIAHGLGEHSGRYDNVVGRLLPMGVSVWAPDHRGHGQSGGRRGHIDSFSQYVEDLRRLVEIARDGMAEDVKIFLLGHSLGGLIALRFAAGFPEMVDGVIISSPVLGVTVDVPVVKAFAGKIMSTLWPTLSLSNELDASKISHDEEVVRAYIDDPLVHNRVSARWFTEFLSAMEAAGRSAPEMEIPLLMQLAGDDHLTSVDASKRFFDALGSVDKTLYIYDGLYHEIYNEITEQKKQVLDDLDGWLLKHI
ncbi:MAG: lysophospholipase [Deltaproteobacteria bacterium]|nr:lysophospholipase [Deltaproteobacteria bacterium]MBW2648591.1 lysophospholipase [Deltaproteobacteria bacterium]